MKSLLKFLKVFSIEFILAFFLGIIVFFAMSGLNFLDSIGIPIESITHDDKSILFICMFIGFPIGASLGVHLAKKFLLKVNEHSILRLTISFVSAFLAGRFLWPALVDFINFNNPAIEDTIFFPIVVLFSLFGYSVADILLRLGKHGTE